MKIKVGVIYGGKSVEHEISVISAVQAMNFMDEEKYDIVPIYITKNLEMYTGGMLKDIDSYRDLSLIKKYAKKINLVNKKGRFVLQKTSWFKREINEIDIALPIVHGQGTEDGTIQGYLELLGIPYVGSNVVSSAVGQDKVFMKQIFEANNIATKKYIWFFDTEYEHDKNNIVKRINKLEYPIIIKPATLGSSIGISIVRNEDELDDKLNEAFKYTTKVLVEEVVTNLTEVNVSVLGNYDHMQTSVIEEVIKGDDILSYKDKYIGNAKGSTKGMVTTRRIIPARIDKKIEEEVLELAKKVFLVLNNRGIVRIDFLIDNKKKKVYVNEINTIPGSLSYYLWPNIPYTELLDIIINDAIKAYKKQMKLTHSFDTNILSNMGTKGLKGGIKK